jgi:hypothetical protein
MIEAYVGISLCKKRTWKRHMIALAKRGMIALAIIRNEVGACRVCVWTAKLQKVPVSHFILAYGSVSIGNIVPDIIALAKFSSRS